MYSSQNMCSQRPRGFACIGLHTPKYLENAGGVMRLAQNYDVAFVAMSSFKYASVGTDTMKAYRHLPLLEVEDLSSVIPHGCIPVAIELIDGATSLFEYEHPQQAFYIFGPENGTLDKTILSFCRDIVYVPTQRCLNLAVTVGTVLYDRAAKRGRTAKKL